MVSADDAPAWTRDIDPPPKVYLTRVMVGQLESGGDSKSPAPVPVWVLSVKPSEFTAVGDHPLLVRIANKSVVTFEKPLQRGDDSVYLLLAEERLAKKESLQPEKGIPKPGDFIKSMQAGADLYISDQTPPGAQETKTVDLFKVSLSGPSSGAAALKKLDACWAALYKPAASAAKEPAAAPAPHNQKPKPAPDKGSHPGR
jgi:hypothetical protein